MHYMNGQALILILSTKTRFDQRCKIENKTNNNMSNQYNASCSKSQHKLQFLHYFTIYKLILF